jgi:curved DNA-binding protein CbpA
MPRSQDSALNRPFRQASSEPCCCAQDGCEAAGLYRAPRSRRQLDDYVWFCLEHVRAFNQSWDYYGGMSAEQIEALRREDTVWQRPTWPLGSGHGQGHHGDGDMVDDFGLFDGEARRRPQSEEEKALASLDLSPPASLAEIKARYKELAKRLHPDANGGDRAREDRLKEINQAYAALKALYGPSQAG